MYLRYKRWRYMTKLAPHVEVCSSGRRYLWNGEEEGIVDVPYKADLEEMLNPLGDLQSVYEIAYEKYGITFDASGKELPQENVTKIPGLLNTSTGSEAETVTATSPLGRPRRR